MDVYYNPKEKINSKKYPKYIFEVVSFREVVRRYKSQKPLKGNNSSEGYQHLFAIYQNDLLLFKPEEMEAEEYLTLIQDIEDLLQNKQDIPAELVGELAFFTYRVQKMDKDKNIFLRLHTESQVSKEREIKPLYFSLQGPNKWTQRFPVKIRLNRFGEIVQIKKGYVTTNRLYKQARLFV